MISKNECFLVKLQSVFGTAETSLTGADDYHPVMESSKVEIVPSFNEIKTVSAGFDQDLDVLGFVNGNGNLDYYIRSLGASTAPDWGIAAQACGFTLTDTIVSGSNHKYAYDLGNTTKDITVWHYKGGRGSSGSILQKYGNIIGDWKISGDTGKVGMFSLVGGKGTIEAADALATLPTPTKNRSAIPPILPVTVSIFGVAYNMHSFEIIGGTVVDQNIKCDANYGFGSNEIGDIAPTFNIKFKVDASLTLPMTGMLNSTVESAITILWGPTGRKIYINIPYPQAKLVKYGEAGNITVYEVSGKITQNSFSITANNDIT